MGRSRGRICRPADRCATLAATQINTSNIRGLPLSIIVGVKAQMLTAGSERFSDFIARLSPRDRDDLLRLAAGRGVAKGELIFQAGSAGLPDRVTSVLWLNIAQGVTGERGEEGAGDQGIMIGYATAETPEMLPPEVMFARALARAMGARDGKSQVTIQGRHIASFITSVCGEYPHELFETAKLLVPYLAPGKTLDDVWTKNPNGPWMIGGFAADSGLTGRKIVVDAYGPRIPVGGGAFSGKDATKVDRSAAYMARKVACDYIRKGAQEVQTAIAYAIGQAEPVMTKAIVDGKEETITGYDLRPRAIIEQLGLRKPQYLKTARYGHFGNNYAWD